MKPDDYYNEGYRDGLRAHSSKLSGREILTATLGGLIFAATFYVFAVLLLSLEPAPSCAPACDTLGIPEQETLQP